MYYAEKFEDGKWWCRSTPTGVWQKFTVAQYSSRIQKLEKIIED